MGTLTADCPQLDIHCPHKLATSCRLTSTPNCCACADERPHSRTYRVYIDGVGFVQRGTRWQGYCWFCKEFWTNRVACTDPSISIAQTQIPHIPAQDAFVAKWFEYHQGYRIVRRSDGADERITILAEPFSEVNPGHLPRTLDEMRRGVPNDNNRPQNRFRQAMLGEETEERDTGPHQTLDEALDSLLEDTAEPAVPDNLLEGPEESIYNFSDIAPGPLQNYSSTEALLGINHPPGIPNIVPRHFARTELRIQRARDRLTRIFGTREEIQEDDYQSPISTMYNRAWDRYRRAEEVRSAEEPLFTPQQMDTLTPQERHEIEQQVLWGVIRDTRNTPVRASEPSQSDPFSILEVPAVRELDANTPTPSTFNANGVENGTGDSSARPGTSSAATLRASLQNMNNEIERLRDAATTLAAARQAIAARTPVGPPVGNIPRHLYERLLLERHLAPPAPPPPSLDNQPDRPPPLSDEEMTKKLACQVCYSQLADIALIPCGHMVMCQWCADVVIPVKHGTVPTRACTCPMCRKGVKSRVKIHIG
ncbi:hypothetical protein P154DRAFT_471607 [Amniculicola lignicola CBS 123094]|uniref:RING-type domain-containing protein n=1 Tax=Amniculicola lignicola CBS 123094 TaxID=1392246 RepID=A0A6A5W5J7_9PLEO|nr:hypothetical protein P154DRAFT_471607 [Amniculicola lignicola CBS 123094]